VSRDALEVASALRYTAQQMVQVAERLEHEAKAERRVAVAVALLDARVPKAEIVKVLMARYQCAMRTAYRAVDEAINRRGPQR
jgi:hypothetical protein